MSQAAGSAASPPGGLEIHVGRFQGPLDLLLHLVRSQDMDILDIPIVEIARQYNAYLERMRELDLEIASEYLLMAATLAHIKSRMLLPPDPEAEGVEEDPRAELSRQLLAYEAFKKAAEELAALESARDLVFTRPVPPPREFAGEVTVRAGLTDLVRAFERILARLEAQESTVVVHREDVRLPDMMQRLLDRLEQRRRFSFREMLEECRTRLERIVLFLALLELIRNGVARARQAHWREDILVEAETGGTT
ncbi:MAG: segregation/condensation protein A [Acidobacteria bacterium]|nr:MAG: segregation/condensation protein A [Acidobacteriota bacterium]